MERYMMAFRDQHCTPVISRVWIVLISLLLGFALCGGLVQANARNVETRTANIEVEVQHGLVTVIARSAPLEEVLRAIGEKAGFTVIIKGNLNAPVTRSLSDVPLEKAIRRLVGKITWFMIYRPSDSERQASAPLRLHVYAKRTRDTGTAEVTQPTAVKSNTAESEDPPASFKGSISGLNVEELARRVRH